MNMSKEEFGAWKANPTTKKVLRLLRDQREVWADGLINGASLRGDGSTAEATGRSVGVIYGLDLLLEMEVEDGE